MLNGRSEVKCRCKGTNRRNRSKGGHTINTAVGPFCIYKVFSSGLEAASTGLRCISMWPRSSQRKAIIRTHLLSEISSDYIVLVRENRGVSFLPEFVAREDLDCGRLAALSVDCPQIEMFSQLVYHRNKLVTPQMELFIRLLEERIQKGSGVDKTDFLAYSV